MKKASLIILFLLINFLVFSQKYRSEELFIQSHNAVKISGTLLMPKKLKNESCLAIIIAGTGPTDREGNNGQMTNNSLKYLSESLSENDISTFRFDKRGVGKSLSASIEEKDLRFEDYIKDVSALVDYFSKDQRFSSIVLIGQAEGSLLGMIAANDEKVSKFISISGLGRPADEVLKDQLKQQYGLKVLEPILNNIKQGIIVTELGQLKSFLRPSIQPYLNSWFKYDPLNEITKLSIPVLLLQGDKDIQIKLNDFELLKAACPNAECRVISKMNHVFRLIKGGVDENLTSYYDSQLPISKALSKSIIKFIK